MTKMAVLWALPLWTLGSQTRDASVTMPALGKVYDASARSVLVFSGTPGTARARLQAQAVAGARCTYAVSAALWFCVSADGQVSMASSEGSSPQALDVPAAPDSLLVSNSGTAAVLWYSALHRLYLVTGAGGAGSAVRALEPSAPVAGVLAVRDDGAMVLARGDDGCAWLLAADEVPRCVLRGDGEVSGAFTAGQAVLLAFRRTREVYLARAGNYTPELLAGPGDGVVEPVAVLGAGAEAFVADRGARVIHAIDLETRRIRAMESPAPPSQFLPLGGGLYLTTGLATGSLILLEIGHPSRVTAAVLVTGAEQ